MGGRRVLAILLVVVAVAVTAVVSGGGASAGSRALADTRAAARASAGWRRSDLRAVTQPVAVGNRFVVYVVHRGGLQVVALDAGTGATVWAAPATPSAIAPGEPPLLAVIDGDVFYLGRGGGSLADVIRRDVRSGKVRWRSALGAFASWPTVCPDATAICLTGLLSTSARRGAELRFDAQTGRQLPGALISKSFGGRELAPGLFDPGQRDPELLLATNGGQVSWRRPLRAVFTLPGASSDWGWNFDRVGRGELFVGSPGWKPIKLTSTHFVADLSRAMTAGFRIGDGAVAWRSPGMYVCNYLPCPGGSEAGFSAPSNAADSGPTVGVRTRSVGRLSGSFTSLPVASASTRVSLEGFDPATGHTTWRFDAGNAAGVITQRLLPPRIDTNEIVLLRNRRRPIALDLLNGRQRPIAPSTAAWCRAPILYEQRTPYRTANGAKLTKYVGQFALYPCSAKGRRRKTGPAVPSFVPTIGAHSGGVIAWTDTKAVRAVAAR